MSWDQFVCFVPRRSAGASFPYLGYRLAQINNPCYVENDGDELIANIHDDDHEFDCSNIDPSGPESQSDRG